MARYKRKKISRSGYDKCQICCLQRPLQEHHLNGREVSNPNSSNNLCYICANCHEDIHLGRLIIEGWFLTSSGKELIYHYKNEDSITNKSTTPPLIK